MCFSFVKYYSYPILNKGKLIFLFCKKQIFLYKNIVCLEKIYYNVFNYEQEENIMNRVYV